MASGTASVNSKAAILHVIDTTGPGGAETVFIELADRLRNLGYRSIVVIRGPGWVMDELARRRLDVHVLPAKGSFNFRFLMQLVRLIRRERVDLVQSHLLGSNIYCAIAGLLARVPVIATFHGKVDVNPRERLRWLKLMVMNIGVRRFVTVSQRLRDEIDREGLLRVAKTTVIYNGIDVVRYGRSESHQLRAQLSLPQNTVLIGCLGNVRPAKAYDILIQAAPLVLEVFPAVHFVIGGDISQSLMRDMLEPLLAQSGAASNIHFLGFCNNSAAFLSELDVFLLCSNSEGFSISTIEAMATGLPVVVTRCGGPEEIVRDGVNALMAEPGDARDIASALIRVLTDDALRNSLACNAIDRVRQVFAIDSMIDGYAQQYEKALVK